MRTEKPRKILWNGFVQNDVLENCLLTNCCRNLECTFDETLSRRTYFMQVSVNPASFTSEKSKQKSIFVAFLTKSILQKFDTVKVTQKTTKTFVRSAKVSIENLMNLFQPAVLKNFLKKWRTYVCSDFGLFGVPSSHCKDKN